MDNGPNDFRIRTFGETSLPLTSYVVYNQVFKGSPVTIMPKHAGGLSIHPEQDNPVVFYNVGMAVVSPDNWEHSRSTTAETALQLVRGSIILYKKQNFFEYLDAPGLAETYPNHTLTVVTLYKHDGSENPTLTYYFDRELPL